MYEFASDRSNKRLQQRTIAMQIQGAAQLLLNRDQLITVSSQLQGGGYIALLR
jgi:hypothetical protein